MGPSHAVHKVWVKKAESTATQVVVREDDLVDSVRDVILRKFANSLGRRFDSADITLCLHERKTNKVRMLGPEEPLWDVIQAAYPNGQLVNEALVIGDISHHLVGVKPITASPTTTNQPDSESKITPSASQAARKGGSKRDRAEPAQAVPPPNLSIPLSIPPIRVLIVEDNPINMRLIHTFLSRLNVRREKATTGEEAVQKWREGGYHLILMDIQLPIMNGLEATQEIRRLERINKITKHGIDFGGGNHKLTEEPRDPGDILENPEMHKGQVIIVALTASSLPSDRRRALAAGCNDFLTKPVNLPYLQKKILEWGCMQALIDFDNWANWKNMAIVEEERERVSSEKARAAPKSRKKKKELAPSAD
ncbi:Response regulator mcs4 [Ceratocystis platani]|uniref:Response regulator mcs4 n=1 Tax=Ceratocystis fimbriata f. sp. platani TaxID=88771 RepID=A0A0F8DJ34_CERFI|nr:Response regulator mcs4 [Ceratocystis platani]